MSYLFSFTDTSSILATDITPPLILDKNKDYSVGLLYFTGTNSLDNVTINNNILHIVFKDTLLYINYIELTPGMYEFNQLCEAIRKAIYNLVKQIRPDNTKLLQAALNIKFEVDPITQLCTISSKPFLFLFPPFRSLGKILGFETSTLTAQDYDKPGVFDQTGTEVLHMVTTSAIHISCNLVESAYINGKLTHLLYSLPLTEGYGFMFTQTPKDIIYLPITSRLINRIELEIRNQNGILLDFKQDQLTIFLHIKEMKT